MWEDDEVNRLDDSFQFFSGVCNADQIPSTVPFFVVFNKMDLFKERLGKIDFKDYQNDFENWDPSTTTTNNLQQPDPITTNPQPTITNNAKDPEVVMAFLKDKVTKLNSVGRQLIFLETNFTDNDGNDVEKVFDCVFEQLGQ